MSRSSASGGFGGLGSRTTGPGGPGRDAPPGGGTGGRGPRFMGGASINNQIVNRVGAPMPAHVEADFRRVADELAEILENKGTPRHLALRFADGKILDFMARWKVGRLQGRVGDDDDIGEAKLVTWKRTTFREEVQRWRDVWEPDDVASVAQNFLDNDARAAQAWRSPHRIAEALERSLDVSEANLSQIGYPRGMGMSRWREYLRPEANGGRGGAPPGAGAGASHFGPGWHSGRMRESRQNFGARPRRHWNGMSELR